MIKTVTVALAMSLAMPAYAGDWDWDSDHSVRQKRQRVVQHRRQRPKQVAAYRNADRENWREERREDRRDDGVKCADKVRGLGTQWIGTSGALDAAKKDWMEHVRYDFGESFLDLTNAKDFVSRCGRVSIGEVAGQVTYRCEIVARPCKAAMKPTVLKD
jgi:hypothetical protein